MDWNEELVSIYLLQKRIKPVDDARNEKIGVFTYIDLIRACSYSYVADEIGCFDVEFRGDRCGER